MARGSRRRTLIHPKQPKNTAKVRRLKDFGIEHYLWVLQRHEEERNASRGDGERRKVYDTIGVRHDATLYFGRPPTKAERSSLSRTCKIMVEHGEAVKYPRMGNKTHLKLTELGWTKARQLRRNQGCSPREVDEAVRASSRVLREQTKYCFSKAVFESALNDPTATPEQVQFAASQYWFLQMEVERVEKCCREYLEGLPLEQARAEVKRIKNGGYWEAPPLFTDGGTGDWPPPLEEYVNKPYN